MDVGTITSAAGPEVSFLPSRTNPPAKAQPEVAATADGGMMPNCPHMGGGGGGGAVTADLGPNVGQHLNVRA